MTKKIIALSVVAAFATTSFSSTDVETRLSEMEQKLTKLEKQLKKSNKKLNAVKAHGAADNIKSYKAKIKKYQMKAQEDPKGDVKQQVRQKAIEYLKNADEINAQFEDDIEEDWRKYMSEVPDEYYAEIEYEKARYIDEYYFYCYAMERENQLAISFLNWLSMDR